jgi:hypothetical protein
MSNIRQMTVAMQRLVDFLSMVTNNSMNLFRKRSTDCWLPWKGNQQAVASNELLPNITRVEGSHTAFRKNV